MQILDARRVLSADRRGSSWPVLAETDHGIIFTKLRGAAGRRGWRHLDDRASSEMT